MQTAPTNFQSYFEASDHSAQYKLVINGVDYTAEHIQTAPRLVRPMMDKPVIGRVCSATLTVTVRERENITVPKAATVDLYCRMARADGRVSGWLALGKFLVSSRKIKKSLITLTCRDYMLKTGRTYLDKTSITTWPQTYQAVAEDIASIIGVTLDSRCSFKTGTGFAVDAFPDDILMSEMLAGIAVCNGGNWIMTETGQLRLVPFTKPSASLTGVINRKMMGFTLYEAGVQTISRVILTAHEGEEEYTAGNDTGYTLEASCPFANQTVADYLCNTTDGILKGVTYLPCKMDKAPINPRIELGDSLFLTVGNGSDYHDYNDYQIVVHSMDSTCNPDFQTDVASNFPSETEDEYPYDTVTETQAKRTVTTNGVYYGNSITHTDGFKSVHESGAYAQFNANTLKFVDANGRECFYYDTTDNTFRINVEELDIISEKLDNIGGTNLMINTLEPSVASAGDYPRPGGGTNSSVGGTASVATHGIRVTAAAGQWLSISFGGTYSMNGFVVGKTYTLSFDASYKLLTGYTGTGTYNLCVWAYVNTDLWKSWNIRPINSSTAGVEYLNEHHAFTFTVPEGATTFRLFVRLASASQSYTAAGDYIETANIKLETGEVATAWSPAPGDLVGNDEIISKINVSPEAIQIAANKISLAGKTIDLTSDTITIQSTNFSVTPAGIITATGVNLTGTFNMTGGTINITTSSGTYDQIVLSYGQYTTTYSAQSVSSKKLDSNGNQFSRNSITSLEFVMYDKNGDVAAAVSNGTADVTSGGANEGVGTGYLRLYNNKTNTTIVPSVDIYNSSMTHVTDAGVYHASIWPSGLGIYLGNGNGGATARVSMSDHAFYIFGDNGTLYAGTSSSDTDIKLTHNSVTGVTLSGASGRINLIHSSVSAALSADEGIVMLNGSSSKLTARTVRTSAGSGYFIAGDGTTSAWRALLRAEALEFRDASNNLLSTYPATGLQMLKGSSDNTAQTGALIAVPYVTHSTLGITTSATDFEVSKAWAKYVAAQYPNKQYCVFIGTVAAGNVRNAQMMAYDTSSTNADGIPNVCNVQLSRYSGGIYYYTCESGTYKRVAFLDQSSLRFLDSNGYSTASYPATSSQLSPTYTTNSYCSSTSVGRVWITRQGSFGAMHFNLAIDSTALTNSAGEVEIMRFSGITLKQAVFFNIPSQSGTSTILMSMSTAGIVKIYTAYGSASGFYRAEVPLMFA